MPDASLATLGDALRRRIRLILIVFASCVLAAAALAELTPATYTAQSQVYVDPHADTNAIDASSGLLNRYYVNEATSDRVLQRAAASFGNGVSSTSLLTNISASAFQATNVVAIDAKWSTPQGARLLANYVARAMVDQNRADAQSRFKNSQQELQNQLDAINGQIRNLQVQINREAASLVPGDQTTLGLYQAQLASTIKAQQDLQLQQSQEADAVSVLQQASVPTAATGPSRVRYIAVGAAVGALLGVILALLLERFDDSLHGPADLALATGVRLIVAVPRPRGARLPSNSYSLAAAHVLARNREIKRLMLVPGSARLSAVGVALDFGVAAAETGRPVLLLQPDPAMATSAQAIAWRKGRGAIPLTIGALGSPASLERELDQASEFDLVLIAVPPLQLESTGIAIAHLVDAAVLVAASQLAKLTDVKETSKQLREAGIPIPACLLVTKSSWGRSWYYPDRSETDELILSPGPRVVLPDLAQPAAGNGTMPEAAPPAPPPLRQPSLR